MKIYDRDYDKKIEIAQGDTAKFDVTFNDYEYQSGDSLLFQVRKNVDDLSALISKTISPATEHIELTANDTNLEIGEYRYGVRVTTVDGEVVTVVENSTFEVVKGVPR